MYTHVHAFPCKDHSIIFWELVLWALGHLLCHPADLDCSVFCSTGARKEIHEEQGLCTGRCQGCVCMCVYTMHTCMGEYVDLCV